MGSSYANTIPTPSPEATSLQPVGELRVPPEVAIEH